MPSPEESAILARHSSTSLRAEVAPLSRSAASEASVGVFGMAFLFCFLRRRYLSSDPGSMSRSSSAELNDLP